MWNSSIKQSFLFLFLFSLVLSAGATDISVRKLSYDSALVDVKKIPPHELDKLHTDEDYNYVKSLSPLPKTAWERFKEWAWEKIVDFFDNRAGNLTIRIIKYIVVAAAICLIVFLLLKNDARALFYKKGASISPDFTESIDDIREINFEERIAEEVSRREFRKAVRLYFLKLIKELHQHRLINWKLDKTNTDYLKELKSSGYYQQFAELSRLYEYIWYGDFPLDENGFLTVIGKFNQFKIKQE